jgi:acetyl-CoA synthetase
MTIGALGKTRENRPPNLENYEEFCRRFSWDGARRELDGLPEGRGLNIAHEAVDRHAIGKKAQQRAIRFLGKSGEARDFTYAELKTLTDKFANALKNLGVRKGERVFALLGRVPELYITALGTFKNRSVFCPLFSAFGPEPVRARAAIGEARVLVTTAALYEKKVAALCDELPTLRHMII